MFTSDARAMSSKQLSRHLFKHLYWRTCADNWSHASKFNVAKISRHWNKCYCILCYQPHSTRFETTSLHGKLTCAGSQVSSSVHSTNLPSHTYKLTSTACMKINILSFNCPKQSLLSMFQILFNVRIEQTRNIGDDVIWSYAVFCPPLYWRK
jgi:hypothetical protein